MGCDLCLSDVVCRDWMGIIGPVWSGVYLVNMLCGGYYLIGLDWMAWDGRVYEKKLSILKCL